MQLEIETGLGRGGFAPDALLQAARDVVATPGARLTSAWTHLQAPEDAARTAAQVAAFERATGDLVANGIPLPWRHVAASGGLLLGHVTSLDGVRPGLAVYGLVPDELLGDDRRPGGRRCGRPAAGALAPCAARPSRRPAGGLGDQLRAVVHDEPAVAHRDPAPGLRRRLAAVPLESRVGAGPRPARPLVGNVAMDAVMADVTDVPGPPVGVGDEFVLIGAQGNERITAAELATARGTISWEVVTDLSARLPRVYHAASVPLETRTLVADEVESRRSKRP